MIKYRVIVADPPWTYDNNGVRGAAADQYPAMSFEDLSQMPISTLAADDCVLLLWATWPKLAEECIPLMSAWGFEYRTGFPWVKIEGWPSVDLFGDLAAKPVYGVGFWIRGATEPILIGVKGNAKPPEFNWVGLICERMQHSRKPDSIYDYAESMPGPYLELFARRRRDGWDAFGNEIENSIKLAQRGHGE